MKKVTYLITLVLLLASTQLFGQVQNTVNFTADLTDLIAEGFDPATDQIEVRGFDGWDGDGVTTISGERLMTREGTTNIYKTTLVVQSPGAAGASGFWKFKAGPDDKFVDGGWELGAARTYTFEADGNTVEVNESVINIDVIVTGVGIQNTITFNADISGIIGASSTGAFDPESDKMTVAGLDWDGLGTLISDPADRVMLADDFTPGLYYTSLTVEAPAEFVVGDSTKWKFKAEPGDRFSNGGWELGSDRWFHYEADGSEITLPDIVPQIFPLGEPTNVNTVITFTVDMNSNPTNSYDGSAITDLEFVGLKGADSSIGAWAGDWTPEDTVVSGSFLGGNDFREMIALNDAGVNGDVTAGDNVWSANVLFPSGTSEGNLEFKYGAWYPNATTVSASSPMDNEGAFGTNHNFYFAANLNGGTVYSVWGDMATPVTVGVDKDGELNPSEFTLSQNYPNPFNPTTVIKYSIAKASDVSLKVYNLLGQEVATLVNTSQNIGSYEVKFNASNLSSGIYFYTLSADGLSFTKKMMLIK